LFLGMQAVVTFIYSIIVGIAIGMRIGFAGEAANVPSDPELFQEYIMSHINLHIPVIVSGCATIFVIFLILGKQWRAESFWGFKKEKLPPVLLSVVLGVSLNLFLVGVLNFLPVPDDIEQPIDILFGDNIILMLISIAVMAAFTEEIIFRGIIQKRLTKMMSISGAIFLQAFIFGVIHMNLLQSSYAFFLGLIIGIVYLWHDSIWIPITIHFVFNGTSVMITHFMSDIEIDLTDLTVITLLSFIAAAGSMIELYRLYRRRTGEFG